MQFSKQLNAVLKTIKLQNLVDNLQKHVTCSKWIAHSSKASIHVNESVIVIKMKSPPVFMNKIGKWLCHVIIMTVYSVNVFQCKKVT